MVTTEEKLVIDILDSSKECSNSKCTHQHWRTYHIKQTQTEWKVEINDHTILEGLFYPALNNDSSSYQEKHDIMRKGQFSRKTHS
jgi:hypothetical protein